MFFVVIHSLEEIYMMHPFMHLNVELCDHKLLDNKYLLQIAIAIYKLNTNHCNKIK